MSKTPRSAPVGVSLLMALVFLPLALGLIGPNPIYGYRTPASYSSPEVWYRANAIAGWIGLGFSAASAILTAALLRSGRLTPERRSAAAWGVFVAAMLISVAIQFSING